MIHSMFIVLVLQPTNESFPNISYITVNVDKNHEKNNILSPIYDGNNN